MALGIAAICIYILGGIGAFGGLALMAFWKERNVMGLGSGLSLGLLFLCAGLLFSIAGVLLMRISRNRWMA